MGKIVGIDLGTTNSCVAILEGGQATVITNEVGGRTTPSVVAMTAPGSILVGAAAKRQAVTNPKNTIMGIKRLIGRSFGSPAVADIRRSLPYEVVRAGNGDAWVRLGAREVSPPEISAHVLRHMKRIAEDFLGEPVTEAIVTVPAYFDDAQRQATKDAGQIAGLEVRAILNEPTAAAFAYGVHKKTAASVIAVFDFGGGTFDVSILRIEEGVFEVLASAGDTLLGGDDFDRAVMNKIMADFEAEHGLDLAEDPAALQRLKEAAERAKLELSDTTETEINIPFIGVGRSGPLHVKREVTRSWLEALTRDLLDRLETPCRRAMGDAKLGTDAIDQVVLVGGMTRMPAVEQKVSQIFGKKPVKGVNPDEVVAIGAATQSAILTRELEDVVLLDVTAQSLGIRIVGDRMSTIIPRNTTIPTRHERVFKTTEDDQENVSLEIFQGDSPSAKENRAIGRVDLGDLPRGPAGSVQVSVSFNIDADGILNVDATEIASGRSTSKTIVASSGLTRGEVARLADAAAARGEAKAEAAR